MLALSKRREAAMIVQVEPVEIDGKFWVNVSIGDKTEQHGPYGPGEAEAVARRLMQFGRTLTSSGGKRG
jgi:hypothetical protein